MKEKPSSDETTSVIMGIALGTMLLPIVQGIIEGDEPIKIGAKARRRAKKAVGELLAEAEEHWG